MNQSLFNLSTMPVADFSFVWEVVKWMMVFSAGIFVIFSLVVMAQIKQMVMALRRGFNKVISIVGLIYFGITVWVLLIAITV
jgi:hypothetical protein